MKKLFFLLILAFAFLHTHCQLSIERTVFGTTGNYVENSGILMSNSEKQTREVLKTSRVY